MGHSYQILFPWLLLWLPLGVGFESNAPQQQPRSTQQLCCTSQQEKQEEASRPSTPKGPESQSLFDGKSLDGWTPIVFGGEGDCYAQDNKLILAMGDPLTGVKSERKDLPSVNYEFSVEARRTEGIDFFCGVTFPYKESHCSLIVGGWAGSTVGLSCVDGKDASDNETKKLMSFDDERWYKIRIKTTEAKIECWIDNKQVVDLKTENRKISLRNDTLSTRPLSLYNFQTTSEFRNLRLRRLDERKTK